MPLYLCDPDIIIEQAPISVFLDCTNYTEDTVMLPRWFLPCEEKQTQK